MTVSDPDLNPGIGHRAASRLSDPDVRTGPNENLTVLMFPESPPSSGNGNQTHRARDNQGLTGLNALEKPVQDDLVLVAFIEQTVPFVPDALDGEWRHPRGLGPLVEDGPFEMVTAQLNAPS